MSLYSFPLCYKSSLKSNTMQCNSVWFWMQHGCKSSWVLLQGCPWPCAVFHQGQRRVVSKKDMFFILFDCSYSYFGISSTLTQIYKDIDIYHDILYTHMLLAQVETFFFFAGRSLWHSSVSTYILSLRLFKNNVFSVDLSNNTGLKNHLPEQLLSFWSVTDNEATAEWVQSDSLSNS